MILQSIFVYAILLAAVIFDLSSMCLFDACCTICLQSLSMTTNELLIMLTLRREGVLSVCYNYHLVLRDVMRV